VKHASTEAIASASLSDYSFQDGIVHAYQGTSMLGTFQPGDFLILNAPDQTRVRSGDVIVFRAIDQASEAVLVVHRVVKVIPQGLITQGDNAWRRDPFIVPLDSLKGAAVAFNRKGREFRVRGGIWGLMRARFLHLRAYLWYLIKITGHRGYRWLRRSKIARRFWQPSLMLIKLNSPDGHPPHYKYVWRGRTVARWIFARRQFDCIKPFDLFIETPPK